AIAAVVHNQFGEKDEALGWLEKARARGYSPAEIRASPELDNLRDEPRFQRLVLAKRRIMASRELTRRNVCQNQQKTSCQWSYRNYRNHRWVGKLNMRSFTDKDPSINTMK